MLETWVYGFMGHENDTSTKTALFVMDNGLDWVKRASKWVSRLNTLTTKKQQIWRFWGAQQIAHIGDAAFLGTKIPSYQPLYTLWYRGISEFDTCLKSPKTNALATILALRELPFFKLSIWYARISLETKYYLRVLISHSVDLMWSNSSVRWVNLGLSIEINLNIGLESLIANQVKNKDYIWIARSQVRKGRRVSMLR